jgi:DNA-binding transcriptional MerR regulator
METFSQGELNRIFGHLPDRTVMTWIKEGLVPWTEETRDRRGRHRRYSREDLYCLGLVEELIGYGLSYVVIREQIIEKLYKKQVRRAPFPVWFPDRILTISANRSNYLIIYKILGAWRAQIEPPININLNVIGLASSVLIINLGDVIERIEQYINERL